LDTNATTHGAMKAAQETGPPRAKALKDQITDDDTSNALKVLRDLVEDDTAPRNLRLAAADSLLDRKHGKAKQMIEQEVKVATFQDFIKLAREREQKYQEAIHKDRAIVDAEIDATDVVVISASPTIDWGDLL